MRMMNWLRRGVGKRSSKKGARKGQTRRNAAALGVEQLETRAVLDSGWVAAVAGAANEFVQDLAVDTAGNSYITGYFSSKPSIFGNFTLTADDTDIFVAKLDAGGNYLWATKLGNPTSANDSSNAISVDAAGNVFITGSFEGTAQFGAQSLTSTGSTDAYVAKLDGNSGQVLWARRHGNAGFDRGDAIAVDGNGSVFISGELDGSSASPTGPKVFVSKFGADGTPQWTSTSAGEMSGSLKALAVDANGDVYASGQFQGTAQFAGETLVSGASLPSPVGSANSNALITKLDQGDGHWIWAKQLAGDTWGSIRAATTAPGGQLYVAGSFEGTLNLDSNALTSAGSRDGFVARVNSATGAVSWARRVGGGDLDGLHSVKVDSQANVIVAGTFRNTANFGTEVLSADGGLENAFVAKLDSAGAIIRTDRFVTGTFSGNINVTVPVARVGIDAANNVYVGGWFSGGTVQFPQQPVTGNYSTGYVVKLPPQAPTKFYVVNDSTANRTYEYAASGDLAVDNFGMSSANTSPRGAASTAVGDKLWVVDANRTVYVYSNSGVLLGSWAAGTMATNASPQGITVSASGDVWIVDSASDKVFKYSGAATRLTGTQNAASSFNLNKSNSNATGIVTDGSSFWVVNSSGTERVFKYNASGTLLGKWAIDGANVSPTGITINPANVSDIWIVDNIALKIFQYTAATSRISGSQNANATYSLAAGNTNPQDIADPPATGTGRASSVLPESLSVEFELPFVPEPFSSWNSAAQGGTIASTLAVGSAVVTNTARIQSAVVPERSNFDTHDRALDDLLGSESRRRSDLPLPQESSVDLLADADNI